MARMNDNIDLTFFESLSHESLARIVFPDSFPGAGANMYHARKACADSVVEYFKKYFRLNVRLAAKDWKTERFAVMVGSKFVPEPVSIPRCNLTTSSQCILYCTDCMAKENKCSPIAKVVLKGVTKSPGNYTATGTVVWLFFHNCHDWKVYHNGLCMSGGFLIDTPVKFLTGGIYKDAVVAANELLHIEKGTRAGSELGTKGEHSGTELPFEYIQGEVDNNLAIMPFSEANGGDWRKKKTRDAYQKFVDPVAHKACIVRLFYCVSNNMGFGSFASPFEYYYDDDMKVRGCLPNRKYSLFAQEESIVVGGFVHNQVDSLKKGNMKYDESVFDDRFVPRIKNGLDALTCHGNGFTVITSLAKGEERSVYIGREDAMMTIPFNTSLVVCGNFPQ